jgi:hypothetical protein
MTAPVSAGARAHRVGRTRRLLVALVIAISCLAGFSPSALGATHVYADTALGAGGWWRNPSGQQLTTAMNFNRMSIQQSWPVRAIVCWNYTSSVFHGVTLPCGWPGHWYSQVFSGIQFIQVTDTYNHIYGLQNLCENVNPNTANGYCAWYS